MTKMIGGRKVGRPPDPSHLQAHVARRIASRLGVSMPVAALLAHLAGIGPEAGRAAR